MDINEILEIIPKNIDQWNQKDVQVWLTYIQLPQLIPNFKAFRIDGKYLLKIKQQFLTSSLSIQYNIIKKKLINWIQYLRASQQYCHQYLQNLPGNYTPQRHYKFNHFDCQLTTAATLADQCHSQRCPSQDTILTKQLRPKTIKYTYIADHQTLHISQKNQNDNKFLVCDQTSITFGRSPYNNFFVVQPDIDPYHCAIVHRQNHHYIVCNSRSSGVWVKIANRMKLPTKCTIQMGEIDFQIYIDNEILTIITFGNRYNGIKHEFNKNQKQIIRIGRRSNCEISLTYDTTLSGYHGKFIYDQQWFFEDLQTTNGSWYKVQKQQLVIDKMMFRMGKSINIFESRVWKNDDCQSISSKQSQIGTCRQCRSNEKNCYFRPCYHNQFCFQCGAMMQICTICNSNINNIERIYKL